MYDQIIKCLVFKQETKYFSIETAKPRTLALLTWFWGCAWDSVTSDCVGILLDVNSEKKLFILLFWLTHPRYDFSSPAETLEASEPCPGSAWRRKTTQAAPWRQRYLCLCVPQRKEGEEPFSASSREKSAVGHREAPPCLASPYRSSTWPLWIAQEQPPGTRVGIWEWTARKNQISSSGLLHYDLHGIRHFILFLFYFKFLISFLFLLCSKIGQTTNLSN